jgi:hypothetical protein
MTFCLVSGQMDSFYSQPAPIFGRQFCASNTSMPPLNVRGASDARLVSQSRPQYQMNQLERDAMDRAFWRSVTVINDGE